MERQNLNKLSEDDLLKALENKVPKQRSFLNDVEKFITVFNISPGQNLVSKKLLYKIYKSWSNDPINPNTFSRLIQLHVSFHQIGKDTYYLMNDLPLDLRNKALKLLKPQVSKIHSKTYKTHFDAYLTKYKIKSGDYYLESFVLYYLYDLWVYKTKKANPLGYGQFVNFCKLYFKSKRVSKRVLGEHDTSKVMWFGLDKSILGVISEEHINQIREGRKYRPTKGRKNEKKVKVSNKETTECK